MSVESAARMDEKTILVGGCFRAVDSLRSALLISRDNGKTWQDTGVWMDGGKTWKRSETELPIGDGRTHVSSLTYIHRWSFRDANRGEAVLGDLNGAVLTYETKNGGDIWRLTRRERHVFENVKEEDAFWDARSEKPAVQRLRTKRDWKKGLEEIQETRDDGKIWVTLGAIPVLAVRANRAVDQTLQQR